MVYNESGEIISKKGNNLTKTFKGTDYVVFDLETCGLDNYHKYKIIEIAAVKVRNNNIVDKFEKLVNPQIPIPKEASNVNGITDDMVKNALILDDIIGNFYKFIGKDVLVGHNINGYDINILSQCFTKLLGTTLNNDFVDTCQLSQKLIPKEEIPNYKLPTLCDYFNISIKPNHRALQDVKANFELYKILQALNVEHTSCFSSKPVVHIVKNKIPVEKIGCTEDVSNKRICLTGDFKCASRDDLKEQLTQLGAKVTTSISRKTDYLLIGDYGTTTTHKIDDANKFGTKVVYEKDFIKRLEVTQNV